MKYSLRLGSPAWRVAVLAVALAALAGCTTIREGRGGPGQRLDPWENWNRKVFNFNEGVDNAVLKPVATFYADVMPQPVRRSVTNFFNNFSDAWSAVNNILQGKFALGMEDAELEPVGGGEADPVALLGAVTSRIAGVLRRRSGRGFLARTSDN